VSEREEGEARERGESEISVSKEELERGRGLFPNPILSALSSSSLCFSFARASSRYCEISQKSKGENIGLFRKLSHCVSR